MTPSLSGRTATIFPGVLPIMRLASTPTATIWPLFVLRATTDGSLSTIPRPRTYTRVFAVPRSTAMSRPRNASALLIGNENLPEGSCSVFCIAAAAEAHREVGRSLCFLHGPGPGRLNEVGEEHLVFPGG